MPQKEWMEKYEAIKEKLTCYIITPYHKCIFCDNSLWYEHHETL